MQWIIGCVGILFGALVGYLLGERRARASAGVSEAESAIAQQRALDMASQLQVSQARSEQLQSQLMQAGNDRSAIEARLHAFEQNAIEQRKAMEEAQSRLKDAFAELSRTALEQNAKSFLQLAEQNLNTIEKASEGALIERKKEIETLLAPVNLTLKQYREELAKLELTRNSAYTDIVKQLASVSTTQKDLSVQTRQLVDSLRRPQTRGRWGELTLRRLLEMAGMVDRCSFVEQVTASASDGAQQRPDCIIKLPESREIIIDSKVVIDAFLDASEAPDDVARQLCLQRHGQQVRKRAEELSKKSYWQAFAKSADYVVMFLPGEAFLYAAVEVDPTLIEDALKSHVLIASPSTLLGLLRVIEMGWRQRSVEENANTIRDLAGELYDRICTMAEHFESLGKSLTASVKAYNSTLGSLERNVVSQARRMAEMGVPGKKEMPVLPEVDQTTREMASNTWKMLQ